MHNSCTDACMLDKLEREPVTLGALPQLFSFYTMCEEAEEMIAIDATDSNIG